MPLKTCVAFVALSIASSLAHGEVHSTHEVDIHLQDDGDVTVHERIVLRGDVASAQHSRSLWVDAPRSWPLKQSMNDVSVKSDAGKSLAFRERADEAFANVDFLEIPEDGVLHLHYRMHYALNLEPSVTWLWNLTGYEWNAIVDDVTIRLHHPDEPDKDAAALKFEVGWESGVFTDVKATSRKPDTWQMSVGADAGVPVLLTLSFPQGSLGPVPSDFFVKDLLALPIAWAALLLLFLAVAQLFLKPRLVVTVTRFANFVPVVLVLREAYGTSFYWYYETADISEHFFAASLAKFGLAAIVALFAWRQYRLLGQVRRSSYFAQFAYPVVLLISLPFYIPTPSMLLFPLLGLPVYLYWHRKSVALEFGVGAHVIAEEVVIKGEVSVAELAATFGLEEARLLRVLSENPQLSVVIDHEHRVVLSPELAVFRKELTVCPYCGGATQTGGMAMLKCGYCEREYASEQRVQQETPLPVVVESLAIFFRTFAVSVYSIAAMMSLTFLAIGVTKGHGGMALFVSAIVGVVFSVPAVLLAKFAKGLRQGRYLGVAKFLLLLSAPLIVPLVVLFKLQSRRVRFFTGKLEAGSVELELRKRGEWSLEEFADYLQSNQEDAAEVVRYLVANKLIDGVYDRRQSRLVSRELYRKIAKEGSCTVCGGYYGVHGGRASCHFCGSSPMHPASPTDCAS